MIARTIELLREAADELERLEKENFKYATALMLISQGYPDSVGLAKAAIAPRQEAQP